MIITSDEMFLLYAAKHYDNPQCIDIEEFHDDIKRFKYLKRLFGKYQESGDIRERLVLNHLIILYNVFGKQTTKMLFYKLKDYLEHLKPFLILMGHMPEKLDGLDGVLYRSSDIPLDQNIVAILRDI